jgi:dTDP-4-dehydrorhamnose 3,5-epimerase-like enzyme
MKILKTALKDVFLIEYYEFKDFRGKYIETFNKKKFDNLIKLRFVQDDFSISKKKCFKRISW